jgi:hypothetical protein
VAEVFSEVQDGSVVGYILEDDLYVVCGAEIGS